MIDDPDCECSLNIGCSGVLEQPEQETNLEQGTIPYCDTSSFVTKSSPCRADLVEFKPTPKPPPSSTTAPPPTKLCDIDSFLKNPEGCLAQLIPKPKTTTPTPTTTPPPPKQCDQSSFVKNEQKDGASVRRRPRRE